MGPQAAMLPGGRLHLQHGPIDLVIAAEGPDALVRRGFAAARDGFPELLPELVGELTMLRQPLPAPAPTVTVAGAGARFTGKTARRMAEAVASFGDVFVTPMAAVAGAVADEMLAIMRDAAPQLAKIWVNNGGDIALHLAGDAGFDAAIVADPRGGGEAGRLTLHARDRIGGVATSGRHGRSLSLGVADAVTVLAANAALADTAATLIANRVDLPGHAAIRRAPAQELDPDSDLGARPVVVDVGPLSAAETGAALARGKAAAMDMIDAGLIAAAGLALNGRALTINGDAPSSPHGPDMLRAHQHRKESAHAVA